MKRLRNLWRKARRSTAAFVRLLTRLCRRFALFVAPLHPKLRWVGMGVLLVLLINLFSTWIAEGLDLPGLDTATKFIVDHRYPAIAATTFILVLSGTAWFGYKMKHTLQRLRSAFGLCTLAEELSLEDLGFQRLRLQDPEQEETHQEDRPFFGKYFPRKIVEHTKSEATDADSVREFSEMDLEGFIRQGRGFLLVDHQYSGKTITVFQILCRLMGYTVVSPDDSQGVPDKEIFDLLKRRKVVILLDNLATLANSNYNLEFFARRMCKAVKHRVGVVGTCREGGDFTKIAAGHGNYVACFCERLTKLRLRPMTIKQRVNLAATAGMALDPSDARNYPMPGNITMRNRVQAMAERFGTLPEAEKDVLRAMKLLDAGGVPPTVPHLQATLPHVFRRDLELHLIEAILRNLFDHFFLLEQPTAGRIRPHFGHLTYAVSYREGHDPGNECWDSLAQALEKARDVEALLCLSQSLGQTNDLVNSLKTLDRLVRIAPEEPDGHYHRGYALARLNRLPEALEANDRALELRADFARAYNNRCYILSRLGQLPGALSAVERALELRPGFDDAHTNRAVVLARLGRFDDAQEEFSAALSLRPKSYYAYLNLGIMLSRQRAFNAALAANKQALKLRPNYPEAYLNRGITLARMKLYEEALKAHEHAIALRPEYAEAHMHRGQTLASLERYPEAVKEHDRAIELEPDYAAAYLNRARTLAHLGPAHLEGAVRDWQTALDLGIVIPRSVINIGASFGIQREFEKARDIFDSVIESNPDYPEAYISRGITLARMGQNDKALADFAYAIKLCPDSAEAYMNRGQTLSCMEQFEKALTDFAHAIKLRPDYAEAYMNRGITLARMGQNDKALADFACAIRLHPDYAEAYMYRGTTLARMGQNDKALTDFAHAIKLRPDYAEAYMNRGITLARMRQNDEALADFAHAIKLRPDY
jgi:tetratricopeptide (TPR) repeat protein